MTECQPSPQNQRTFGPPHTQTVSGYSKMISEARQEHRFLRPILGHKT